MLKHILDNGEERNDRTGTGTIGVFGYQNRYDLNEGFPLVTTKSTSFRLVAEELLWFLRGETNIKPLVDKDVNIWNADAYRWYTQGLEVAPTFESFVELIKSGNKEMGELGPVYGKQWRSWSDIESNIDGEAEISYIDQIANVIKSIKEDPYGRRHIVTAWNPADMEDMALPPCHLLFQFYVSISGKLSCQLYQRSADAFLGVPFNIASYALLIHLIAHATGLKVGEFVHTFGDLHIYKNHIEQVKLQLTRTPKYKPVLVMYEGSRNINDFNMDSFRLHGYSPHPAIKGKVSVGK